MHSSLSITFVYDDALKMPQVVILRGFVFVFPLGSKSKRLPQSKIVQIFFGFWQIHRDTPRLERIDHLSLKCVAIIIPL
jgi:hypothetical protein